MPFRRFLSFLTVGNKSECGTLQCLTHPRQSTAEPALMPTSFPKRQVSQRKSCVPSSVSAHSSHPPLLPTCLFSPPTSSSHLPLLPTCEHRGLTSQLRPTCVPGAPQIHPQALPRHSPDTPPGTPQIHPQAHPRLSPRHSPGTPRALPQAPPQALPRHTPRRTPDTPQTHPSLPKVARNSSRASFADGLKTPEYQRSYFKT